MWAVMAEEGRETIMYLECKSGTNTVCQNLGDHSIKGRQNLHRQLRFDTAIVDQIIESIGQSKAKANRDNVSSTLLQACAFCEIQYLLPRYNS